MMKLSRFGRSAAALGAILALGLAASVSRAQLATFCAEVKLEILQEATLEREAFDASLKVNNNLPDKPLTNLRVNIFVKDELGNPADSAFFIKIATLTNTNAIDGTGVVQSSTTAEIRWLIIPSTGAGGILTGGKRYSVRATINGISADAPQSVTTFDDFITVYPQPSLKLEYVLPYEVFGDEPLTAGIEPIEPFPLGVRVTNIGYGLAKNFKIESAQPKIVENKQGLLVDFKLLGTVVGGVTIPDTLLVPFGNIAPQGVGQASWIMSTSLSGRFIEFTSTFTHAAELGGQLTSLIESVTTYTLLRDVLVDLPGRDATPDFLVNASMDRAQMQALLDAGGQPPAELLLESDQQTPLAVLEAPAALSGSLGGTSASLTLAFTQGVGPNLWVHASAPITRSAGLVLQSARASDGRALNAKNVWISKHFRKSDLSVAYRINILDLTSGASSYTINFDPASLDAAPGRVIDLAAVTAPGGGALNLSWSAPGDDGYTGRILGGRYLIEHEIVASAPFTPTLAQVNSATSTAPGNSQFYTLGGLVGNASTYLRLWTQDTGGAISEVSNGATAYTLPNPPRDLLLTAISSVGAHAAWQAGNNSSPIAYRVYAATAADGVAVSSSPYKDSFVREFDFANLAPSTTYTVFGEARNPYTAAMSPRVTLGLFMTSAAEAATSDSLSPRTALVVGAPSYSSATVIVSSATPLHLTAVDDELVIGDGLGRGDTVTFLSIGTAPFAVVSGSFSLVAEGTHTVRFYSVDLAGNVESVQTRPISVDLSAPVSLLQFVGVGNTDARGMLVISTDTLLGFTANDPNSSGVAAGVKQISVGVDGGALAVYQAPFALSPGFHAISYFAMDNLNNTETPRTVQISVGTPPLTSVEFVAKSTIGADAQTVAVDSSNNVYVSAGTRILKLNPEGQLLTSWGSSGSGPGQLGTADGMRIGPDGNLYVSDSVNRVVHVFEPSGAFLTDISGGFTALAQGPLDVAFDSKGQLNVLDIRAGQIFRMQLDGSPIATIPVVPGSFGGLAIDPQDNMYVANFTARRVQKYTAAGQQLLSFGGEAGSAALNRPRDLDIDPAGRVHVADWFGNRIAVYGSTGTFIGEYGTYNTNPDGVLQLPTGIAILKSGARVWISPPGPGQAVLQYALQTMLPSAPVIVSPMGNIRVYGAAPLIVGRAKAGMKVTLFDAGLLAATTAVWDSSGLFAIQIPLSVGPHRITAQTISNMGFSSPLSGAADFTLAAAPPAFNFASPVLSRIPNPPSEGITAATTVIADFDGDGNPDLFAIGGSGYAVFLGDGKGNFRKPPPVYFPGSGNFSGTVRAYAADLNKDGKMDVVILDRAPLLRVMSGNGNGTFGDGTYQSVTYISQGFPAGYAPLDFFLADLNNDANLDIITTDGRSLGVLLGQGDPGFTFAPQPLVPTGGSPFLSPHALQTADLNRDGKLDVVTEGGVFFGDGRGGFSSSTVLCAQCRFPLIGDFNQDGNPDIALNASNGANVFVGFGDGTFKALPPQPSGGLMGTLGVTGPVLDLNGDGLQDLVYGDFSGNVTLHPGRGDGLFGAAQTISLGSSCSYIETISAADFNKDGAVDLASALNFNPCTVDEVSVLFNRAVPPDGVPPAAVADLAAQSNRDGTVRLTWISPGDNGVIGQAAVYDLRVATAPMTTPALFNSAASLSGVSTPLVAGSSESFIVAGLPGGTTFYFALRTTDRAGNTSALSNGPAVKTPFVTRSIASINGQPEFGFVNATLQPSLTVIASTSAVGTLVLGSATAQGLAFVSRIYELQPEGATFAPPATMTMRYSTAALAGLGLLEQDLALYRFAAVQGWIRIPDQTLDTQNKLITVPIGAIMSIYALGGIVRDLTPPLTILITVTDSRFIDSTGGLYGSSSTAFGFAAFDPIAFGTASGVAFTQFRIDAATPTAPFSLFTTSYALAEGRHLLEFRSQDAAGNLEITRSSQVFVDGTAPRTSLVLNGPRAPGSSSSTFVVSSGTSLGFQSIDPLVNGAASGAAKVNFRVDGGTFAVFSATFTLTPGEHSVEFDAVDNVGNVEAVQRAMIFVDTQTPNVILISPKGGERFLAGVSTIAVQFVVTHPLDPAATFYATFVEQQDRGSPRGNRPAVVVVSSGQVLLPLDLDDGLWQLRIAAADYVLNATVVLSAPFEIVHDTMPPRISLAISTPQAPGGPGGAPFVIGRTLLTLSSIDDLVGSNDALGLGTAFQEVSVNGLLRMRFQNSNPAQGQVFSSSFTLNADSDGVHILTFIARDVLQNQTVVHRTTVAVDNTPPATRLIVSTPSFGAFVSIRTALTLSAVDPLLNGVASGIAVTRYQDNGGTFTASTAPLALAEGAHMVAFQSADNLGNQEALRSTNVLVDATPPVATVAIGLPAFNSADGTIYITPATPVIFSAADPTLAGSTIAGSGLAHIEIAVDGAPFAAYVTTLTFTEGRHTVSYRAVDNVGNVEPARTLALLSDATPPASALGASGAYFAAAGRNFAPPSFVYALSAQDVVANGVASGLSATMFRVDGSSFSRYVSTFSLTEGVRRVDFQSADTVDNLELLKSATVFVDATAPITALAVLDGRQFPGPNAASFYASSDTRFSLPAADPVAGGVASGLAHTRYQDNAGVFQIFASPFGLLEGAHLLAYQSQDNVLNMEVLRSTTVLVDATAPVSSATIGSPFFIGADGTRYITPVTPVTLSAFDPVVNAVASGVDRIEISIDGGAFGAYASTLIFAEGRHTILYRAVDRVGNVETTRRLELQSDNTPPATAFTPSGALFSAGGRSYAPAQFTYALPAQDPVVSNVASGVAFTNYRTGQAAYQNFVSAFSLSEGIRRVEFQSQDNIGNLELLKSATVFVDATVPVSALAVGNPKFDPGSGQPVFVTAATLLTLSAQDPVVQEVASGVRQISLRRGADAFAPYVASFTLTLPDGLKTVDYFSTDNVGNVEVARSTSFALDNTAPATALAVLGGRQFAGPSATSFYASSDTRLALPAVDPTVNGVASGLALTQWQDNGGALSPFASSFGLPEGVHTLGYQSQDRVQNLEVLRSTTVLIDATPPVTAAQLGAPLFTAVGGIHYIAPATPVTFTASDPAVSGVASGVNRIEVAVDGGAFAAYTSALTFAEGRHTILYRAVDNVANLETVQTLQVQSDATPPAASLAIGAPKFDPGAGQPVFVAATTRLTLSAQDPVVQNVASGVRQISFRRGGDAFGAYAAPFGLALPDGLKTLDYFATDNVGNQEITRSTAVALDASAPVTSLAVLGGRQFPGPNAGSFYASSDTRLALPAVDPAVGGVASGLALTQWQDNSSTFQNFASPFGLAEGSHLLAYQSQDRVLNLEVPRSTTVLVDATPPVSSALIGAPAFTASDGTIYITPSTPLTLSAVDPALPTGQPGSAVSRIEVAIDGGPFAVYSAALTFAEGRHTILYRAIDNVANVEVIHTLQLRSDATPPVSSLVVGQPRFQLPSVLLVSTRTPFSIAPVDPIVNNVASGLKDTSFRVSGASPFAAFTAPFTMTGGDANKVIEFFSRDNVLNTEVVKSSTVLLDSTPPEVALLSPASCGAGICRVLKGKFPVLGTARDTHFADYRLEFAPGKDASAGFALISSGTLAMSSGTLATWDATALSGWSTVRLSAVDLVANTASVAFTVFVGDPGQLMLLGNHEIFDMPEGVAVGGDGKIYVADRNNDRIVVFSSTGALLVSLGGHKDDDQGKHKASTTTVRLNKPSGVAVDASGNIYVADTNRDRVLKLSAAGEVVLTLGLREHEDDDDKHTRLPGQFQHPAGVAVDSLSNIYVADTGNHRVQVFNSAGVFSFQFDMPPVPDRLDHDDDEKDDDDDGERAELGKPSGIAVDAAGHIYVADSKGGRALKFGATGQLLLTIPIMSDKPGRQGQPFGVAVSAEGDCLLVSDRKTSRILKFDFLGNSNLVFASKGKIDDDDAPAPSATIVLKKPMGLALDAHGNLFVADRNNDRIQKFGLPTGAAPLVVPTPKDEDDHIARGVVDTEDGGKIERRDRAAVDIPAGAVALDLKVTVSTPAFSIVDDSNRRRAAEDANLKTASPPVEYGPHGTQFRKSVTLTLPYSPDLLALQKIDAKDLQVRYWNRDKSKWEDLESVVDLKTRTVKAKTTHFSLYQVFSGTVSAAAFAPLAADAAFTFRDAYAFPNPVRGSGSVTIRIQTGLADSVEVRVYDVSGRKIHSSSNFSLNPNFDDGNGKGAQYTYDHVWDVSGVGSGVYQYVISAKKSGQSDVHKTGRVGIIK